MARMAGVNRSQVNRWSRGENRPGYDPVRKLALAVWRSRPDLARELVEASGYAWAEPGEVPEPPPIDPKVLAALRDAYRGEPEKLAEAIRAIAQVNATSGRPEEAPSSRERNAG